ncbi:cytochrome P450 [Rhodobacteraceae bacterium KN286]|uniref:Cytochrome P450 n=2 Tax=Oceanomicrobium pacificus TaxID=2692916 RepID=A0A6B0TW60_9RHOB|nr:cytochrome P450 [Oceanomicrobium pacificus]
MPAARLPVRVPLVREPWGILRTLKVARRNLLEIIPEIATTQPIVSGRTGIRWHMLMDPDAIQHVVKDRLADYPKSDTTKRLLRPAIGDSLFIAEGAHWRWQRQAVAPVFRHRNIAALAPVMQAGAEASLARLDGRAGQTVDLYGEMVATTFDVINRVTFSGTSNAMDSAEVQGAIEAYIEGIARVSLLDMFGLPDWVPRPGRLFGPSSLGRMRELADAAIDRRRADGGGMVDDLLDLLLVAEDPETGRQMRPAELRDNLLTFIVAGHETTALTLSWALYLCAFDPDVQDRARAEVQAACPDGRLPGPDELASMPLVRQIIEETLRLYPPAAILSRTALADDTLCGREIRRGDTVMIPVYALHRNRLLWDDPDAFRPARFADTRPPRFAYLPFGDGPRICIGMSFALMEAQIILASLLGRYRFTAIPGRDPRPEMLLTLRPAGGVRLRVERA